MPVSEREASRARAARLGAPVGSRGCPPPPPANKPVRLFVFKYSRSPSPPSKFGAEGQRRAATATRPASRSPSCGCWEAQAKGASSAVTPCPHQG